MSVNPLNWKQCDVNMNPDSNGGCDYKERGLSGIFQQWMPNSISKQEERSLREKKKPWVAALSIRKAGFWRPGKPSLLFYPFFQLLDLGFLTMTVLPIYTLDMSPVSGVLVFKFRIWILGYLIFVLCTRCLFSEKINFFVFLFWQPCAQRMLDCYHFFIFRETVLFAISFSGKMKGV